MEDLQRKVDLVYKAVFGDDSDRDRYPGLVTKVPMIDERLERTNKLLTQMLNGQKKIMWTIISFVLVAVLNLVIKHS